MTTTLYRKHRPQTLSSVLGQEQVTGVLSRAIHADKVAQAYLFAGSRGTGKTSVARILAKALNCLRRKESLENLPCNTCVNCLAIDHGAFLDVLELDAASNRGIDEIRQLKEGMASRPVMGERKVYILDEVHMLTNEAFNALLKTLEEPPSHAVFILCTTEPYKVPITIASRCQRFTFARAGVSQLETMLRQLAIAEQIDIEADAITLLAHLADGGYRDGAMLLEQVSLHASPNIQAIPKSVDASIEAGMASKPQVTQTLTRQYIETQLGLANRDLVVQIVTDILLHKPDRAVELVEEYAATNGDIAHLVGALLDKLQVLLIAKTSPKTVLATTDSHEAEQALLLVKDIEVGFLLRATRLLLEAQARRHGTFPALALELALLESSEPSTGAGSAMLVVSSRGQSADIMPVKVAPAKTQRTPLSQPEAVPPSNKSLDLDPEFASLSATSAVTTNQAVVMETIASEEITQIEKESIVSDEGMNLGAKSLDMATLLEAWYKILNEVRPKNHMVEALLRDCTPLSFDGTILLLQFWYAFHKKQLEITKNRVLVESVASHIIGTTVKVKCQLGDKSLRPKKRPMGEEDVHNVAGIVEDSELVEAAAEIFGGEYVD
jgi:DNA polymerase-3 subunit gamma/tau